MSYNVIYIHRHLHGICGFPCQLFNTCLPSHSWSNFSCKMVTSVWQPGLDWVPNRIPRKMQHANTIINWHLQLSQNSISLDFAPVHSPVVLSMRDPQSVSMLFSPIKADGLQLDGSVPTPHFLLLHPSCWKAPCFQRDASMICSRLREEKNTLCLV